ncbi:hypothetical protein [Paenibacillus lutimineralis]|uniref:Uncharacterized protein n=1 Tax=Paenibacillus lutimineralis TaxID=2707005 RepID=A0A3S9V459_9BACL|nr:hypothetical protein [Paenibacillus lutimineralis]AZS17353.1 hypothetical protein EI981_24925 [Paenibacillus lutimineralis]
MLRHSKILKTVLLVLLPISLLFNYYFYRELTKTEATLNQISNIVIHNDFIDYDKISSISFSLNQAISEKKMYLDEAAYLQRSLMQVRSAYQELIQLYANLHEWKGNRVIGIYPLLEMLQDYSGFIDYLSKTSAVGEEQSRKYLKLSEEEIQSLRIILETIDQLNQIREKSKLDPIQDSWVKIIIANDDYVFSPEVIEKHKVFMKYLDL